MTTKRMRVLLVLALLLATGASLLAHEYLRGEVAFLVLVLSYGAVLRVCDHIEKVEEERR